MQRSDLERKVSVIHQHVDGTDFALDCLDHSIDLLFVRHIGLINGSTATGIANLRQNFVGCIFVLVIIHGYCGAALRQTHRRGGTDTAAGTGHEDDFSFE